MAAPHRVTHVENMVSQILMLIALVATIPAAPRSGARVEIRVSATIQRGVTVRSQQITTDFSLLSLPSPLVRPCDTVSARQPDCHLIVYDLP
jgi:hypothetical protein